MRTTPQVWKIKFRAWKLVINTISTSGILRKRVLDSTGFLQRLAGPGLLNWRDISSKIPYNKEFLGLT
jgi:hypothetical protein